MTTIGPFEARLIFHDNNSKILYIIRAITTARLIFTAPFPYLCVCLFTVHDYNSNIAVYIGLNC